MSKSDTPDDPGQSYQSLSLSRRRLLQGTGAAAGTAAGIGGMNTYAVEEAEAVIATSTAVAIAGGAVGGAAIGYLTNEVVDHVTGPDVAADEYNQLTGDELHNEIYSDAIKMASTDDTVLTTIENQLNNAKNIAYSNAKKEAIRQFELGNTESTATTKAKEKVTQHYLKMQKNLIEHFAIQINKIVNMEARITSELAINNVMKMVNSSGSVTTSSNYGIDEVRTEQTSLVDGSSYALDYIYINGSAGNALTGLDTTGTYDQLEITATDTSDNAVVLNPFRFRSVWSSIKSQHTTVSSEIDTFVTNVKPEYDAGNIDTTDLVSAADLSQDASNNEGFAYAAADLAELGIAGADQAMKIELHGAGITVKGTLYLPNSNTELDVGKKYDGSDFTLVYLAYQYTADQIESADTDGSDFIELDQEFTVLEANNQDGSSTDTLTFSDTNQQTTDTDAQTVNNQLDQLARTQQRIKEQQEAAIFGDGGGGGGGGDAFGFSFGGGNGNVILLAGAGIAAYLIGSD